MDASETLRSSRPWWNRLNQFTLGFFFFPSFFLWYFEVYFSIDDLDCESAIQYLLIIGFTI